MKNSVGMLASHHFSHRTLTGISVRERKVMLADIGVRWDDLDQTVRQGTFIRRQRTDEPVTYWHKKEQVFKTLDVQRNAWAAAAAPCFDSLESLGLA
ncbi:hypothetical protein RKD54_001948 [Pseudarthrobacter sp. SLBN-100]|uniref:hypothetical protein n=1 Tax=Arthrobacter sp. SLBN-100 TaxID=2768450 RepID=UPI0011509F61|nr:hypothetical protein [Arthrobacter sp. SLBN-100]